MAARRNRTWVPAIAVAIVAVGVGVVLVVARHDRPHIAVRESHALTYVAYVAREDTINDAIGYRGTIEVDSHGCVYFDMTQPVGRYYRAAFRDGTEVSPDGVRTPSGRLYAFGDKVAVGREYGPYFDALDTGCLSGCDLDLEVFGMGLA